MFDIFAKLLSSIASFLFPLFASYKALKTSDPAQLTPWLMYWVVLACALLVESWTEWFLVWIPFYAYIRLLFLLYLVLPQTQGARIIYQQHIHPWLEDNEGAIEDFIASAHERLRAAGIAYIKRAIELLKTNVLGLPPSPPSETSAASAVPGEAPPSYTQTLLARFSLPNARWSGNAASGGAGGSDFYNFLASAVSAAAATAAAASSSSPSAKARTDTTTEPTLIPSTIRGTDARMDFIAAQRERLNMVLSALDREATQLQTEDAMAHQQQPGGFFGHVAEEKRRSMSGSSAGGLSKSRSEADFEKLEAESGAEDDMENSQGSSSGGVRRRTGGGGVQTPSAGGSGSWVPWGWGGSATPTLASERAKSSAMETD